MTAIREAKAKAKAVVGFLGLVNRCLDPLVKGRDYDQVVIRYELNEAQTSS